MLLLPVVRVRIQAGDTFALSIKYLFFTFRPPIGAETVEKAAKKAKPDTVEEAKALPEKAAFKLGVSVEEIMDLIADLWPPVRRLIRAVKITGVRLHIVVGGADAGATAIGYGRMCGYVSTGSALLFQMFKKVEIKAITVEPDFLSEASRYNVDVTLGLRPIRLVYTFFVLVKKSLPMALKILFPKGGRPKKAKPKPETAPAAH